MGSIKKILLNILKGISILCAISLAFAILACYISPAKLYFLQFFGLFFQIIFIANLIALIFWRIKKDKFAYIHLVGIVIACFYLGRFVQISLPANDIDTIKIISFNIHGFGNIDPKGSSTHEIIAEFLLNENADIICLQDYFMKPETINKKPLFKQLMAQYPYFTETKGDAIIFSKFEIDKENKIGFLQKNLSYAKIKINNSFVAVYNCHLESTKFNPDVSQEKILQSNNKFKELISIIKNLKNAFIRRAEQADKIAEHISKSEYPTIMCGDFNDTPMSYTYQKILGDMNDSFVKAGTGISHTFNKLFSMLRIDYIFASTHFEIKKYKEGKNIRCSDHLPVIVNLKLK